MIAYIKDNSWIYLDQITQGSEEVLVNNFSVKHPRSYYIKTGAGWDGWYRKYSVSKQRLALPLLDMLKKVCEDNDIPLEISDTRGPPEYPSPQKDHITDKFLGGDIILHNWQVEGLHASIDKEIGVFDMTTGAGKTEIMCGLVKMHRCPTLILTEQIVVLEQIVERLELHGVVHNNDVGQFCYGKRPDGNLVIVGSIQSLNTPSPPPKQPKEPTKTQIFREGKKMIEEDNIPEYLPDTLIAALKENPKGIKKLTGRYLQSMKTHIADIMHKRAIHWNKVRKKNAAAIQIMARKCDLLLIDECDKASGDSYKQLFKKIFCGRRRYGFSGTPFNPDKPVEALHLKERLGTVISAAERSEVTAKGQIVPIKYISVAFGEDGDKYDSTALDIAEREIIYENVLFHRKIKKLIEAFPDDKTMILVDTLNIEEPGLILEEFIPGSKFIYGKTSKAKRRKVLKDFEDGELKVLIGGKILKRGLDLDGGVDNLIIIGGGKNVSNFDQMIGRAVRKNKRGYARVFDFLFLNNKYLYQHSRARLKAVVGMGYKSSVLINGQEIDGQKFVKSRFRIPKKKIS